MKQPFLWIPNCNKPIYIQLYECIRKSILKGEYKTNEKMPSIRSMAKNLNISKTTVETSYQQLIMEGYIRGIEKVGYFVEKFDEEIFKMDINEEIYLKELNNETFTNEKFDKNSFDLNIWKRYLSKGINEELVSLFQYGHPQGERNLRCALSEYVRSARGVIAFPEQIVIGAGTQQLLFVLSELLKEKYKSIYFEKPIFGKASHIFNAVGYKTFGVDNNDLILGNYGENREKNILYVSPSHQFPYANTMSIAKRLQILKWAQISDGLIIEDDYDGELRYQGQPIPSLQGINKGKRVVYLGAFSKILLPSIRIGFMVLPEDWVYEYQKVAHNYSQTVSQIEQFALAKFIEDGSLERHVRKIRNLYAKKSKKVTEELVKAFGEDIEILASDTGLYIVFKFTKKVNSEKLNNELIKCKIKMNIYEDNEKIFIMPFSGIELNEVKDVINNLNKCFYRSV